MDKYGYTQREIERQGYTTECRDGLMIYSDESAINNIIATYDPLPEAKVDAINRINEQSQSMMDAIELQYPSFEKHTWPAQKIESEGWVADNEFKTPTLDAIALSRGVNREDLIRKAYEKVTASRLGRYRLGYFADSSGGGLELTVTELKNSRVNQSLLLASGNVSITATETREARTDASAINIFSVESIAVSTQESRQPRYDSSGLVVVEPSSISLFVGETRNSRLNSSDLYIPSNISISNSEVRSARYDISRLSAPITITVNPRNTVRVKRKNNNVRIKRKTNTIRVK